MRRGPTSDEESMRTGATSSHPAPAAPAYASALSAAPSYMHFTASGRPMFGLLRALCMAPLTSPDIILPDSPLPGSGVATNRAILASESIMTAKEWRLYEQFPYTACLYSPRVVAFIAKPSPTMYLIVYLAPHIPRKGVPSASPASIPISAARLRSCEYDGVSRPPACSLTSPSSGLHAMSVPALKIAADLIAVGPNLYGRPFLPLFSSSTPPNSSSRPMTRA